MDRGDDADDDGFFTTAKAESINPLAGKVPEFFKPCWLNMEGLTSFMSWKRRWFVLDVETTTLKYYDSEDLSAKPAGTFLLMKDSQVAPSTKAPSKAQEKAAFLLRTGSKTLHVCAKDETEKATKMRELSLMIIHMFPENLAAMQEQERLKAKILAERNKEHDELAMSVRRKNAEEQAKKEALAKMTVPEKVNAAKQSGDLDLASSGLMELPKDIPKELPSLVNLNLSRNALAQFPILFRMTKLETIDLSYNRLPNVPDPAIGEWAESVTSLLLNNNLLWGISAELGTCAKLTKLDLRNNALEEIPLGLGRLTRLEELFLENNPKIKGFPSDFSKLVSLEILDANSCAIEKLPENINGLTRLLELNLASNKLSALPESMHTMSRLASVNLCANKLNAIPLVLGRCSGISKIDVSQNPIVDSAEKKLADLNVSGDIFEYLRPKAMLAYSKVSTQKKEVKVDVVYNPQVARNFTTTMILKLDEIRKELTLAATIPDAVKHAIAVKNLKPGIDALRQVLPPLDPVPPPVIHPGEDKLSQLQKTAGAALKDAKNTFTAVLPLIEKTAFPSKEFEQLTEILKVCRAALGYQDYTIELK